jgi:hypothetical protein
MWRGAQGPVNEISIRPVASLFGVMMPIDWITVCLGKVIPSFLDNTQADCTVTRRTM